MSSEAMTLARFRELASTYGAATTRWPAAEQPAAHALLAESDAARALLAVEESLDALFDAQNSEPVSKELGTRLAQIPKDRQGVRRLPLPKRILWGPAIGWAAAAGLGLWLGAQTAATEAAPTAGSGQTDRTETAGAASSTEDELLEVARGTVAGFEDLP